MGTPPPCPQNGHQGKLSKEQRVDEQQVPWLPPALSPALCCL
jgi:hypothetical protein